VLVLIGGSSAPVSVSKVMLCQAQLVLVWVTIFSRDVSEFESNNFWQIRNLADFQSHLRRIGIYLTLHKALIHHLLPSIVCYVQVKKSTVLTKASDVKPKRRYPFSSDRQQWSYDVCQEVRGEIIRTVVLYCEQKLCTVISTLR